jgi:hypothetical protein
MKNLLKFIGVYIATLFLVGLPMAIIWIIFDFDWSDFFFFNFIVSIIIILNKERL